MAWLYWPWPLPPALPMEPAHAFLPTCLRSVISEPMHFWEKQDELWISLVAQPVKNLLVMRETRVWSLVQKDPLEKRMVAHSSILAQRIPWTEQPDGLQSLGSQRVGHDSVTNTHTHTRELHGHNCYSWKMSSQTKEWKPRETINHPLILESSVSRFWSNQGDREPPNSHKKQESSRNQDSAVQIKQLKTWIRTSLIIYCCPSTTLHNCAGWTLNSLGSTISNITDREFCIDCKLLQVECDKVSWWRDAIF